MKIHLGGNILKPTKRKRRYELQNLKYLTSNFKSITSNKYISLKPITIFCGVNSIGKSSILQSKLLISQSLSSRLIPFRDESAKYPQIFIFEGNKCHLQNYKNIIFENNIENKLKFSWVYNLINRNVQVDLQCKYIEDNKLFTGGFPVVEKFIIRTEEKGQKNCLEANIIEDDYRLYNVSLMNFEEEILADIFRNNYMLSFKRLRKELDDYPVVSYIRDNDKLINKMAKIGASKKVLRNLNNITNAAFTFSSIIPRFAKMQESEIQKHIELHELYQLLLLKKKDINEKLIKHLIKRNLHSFEDIIQTFLNTNLEPLLRYYYDLLYLGPLREEPKRFYLFSDLNLLDIGLKGENTTQVLILTQNSQIDFVKLEKINGEFRFSKKEKKSLLNSLNEWLGIMNLQKIRPLQTMDIISKLMIKYSDNQPKESSVAIPDVGFGLSQVLPVLVEVLRMESEKSIILEQPEIHLHPRMQGDLADFILCNAQLKKNFIIETHSEHFIKRLCLRIAQFKDINLSKLISIYFIVPNNDKKGADIVDVQIDEFGKIKNWPIGFFDGNEDQQIFEESLKKRDYKKRNGIN